MKMIYFVAAVALCSVNACRQAKIKESAVEPTRVKVAEISRKKMSFPILTSGLVVSAREVKLSFKTGGIIAGIFADEGTRVKKGELLAILNLSEIEALVNQVTNGYEKAVRDYNRVRNLYADSVVTLEQLQNAETAMNVSKASLEAATFNLNHSRIIAPENGTILKRLAENNEIISPGYPVFLIGTSGKYWKIKAGLADRDFVRIIPGDSARVKLDAYPGVNFKAVVNQVSEAANPLTGTYEIELDLQHTGHKLASGFVANLEIFPAEADTFFQLPVEALVETDGQTGYVFTVTDSMKAKKIKVSIARIYNSSIAVSGGSGEMMKVITEGAAYLSEGDRVTIIE